MLSIDFETYSEADLPKVGVSRYAEDPSTEVLCVAWGDEREIDIWYPGLPLPQELMEHVHRGMMFSAFNASFEMSIWAEVCVKKLGWPAMPVDRWCDSQADAMALGMPGKLEHLIEALGSPYQKDPAGKRLIKKLCCPVKPTKAHPTTRWTKAEAPEDFALLYQYCKGDVRAEIAVANMLPYRVTVPEHMQRSTWGKERRIWQMTWEANRQGIPVDVATVDAIISKIEEKVTIITDELQMLVPGLKTIGQKALLLNHINSISVAQLTDMQGPTLLKFMKKTENPEARRIIELYAMANYASIAKFKKMRMQICRDHTIKDNHRYHGAGTGRDAGAGVQIQNLPRASVEEVELAINMLQNDSLDEVEWVFGNVLALASAMCRPVLWAPPGYKMFNADLGQIEARMTAWIAQEENILQAYRDGLDAYKAAAAGMYHIEYQGVTKNQRQAGKIAVLACLAIDSPVLTDRGYVPIQDVLITDKVWDGISFVNHDGVVFQGMRETIIWDGLKATPDHRVLVYGKSLRMIPLLDASLCGINVVKTRRDIKKGLKKKLIHSDEVVPVFDILNAGPNHRFTVNGRLVSNCGFQGGPAALLGFAEKYGIRFTADEAQEIVNAFRESRPKLVATWRAFGAAAADAINGKDGHALHPVSTNNRFGFVMQGPHLFMSMPNGRAICFPFAKWEQVKMPWGSMAFSVTHMWCNSEKGGKWERRNISGASLMQSAVQGLSRDVLMEGCLRLWVLGYPHIFRVHDELTSCIPENEGDLEEFAQEFIRVPAWCPDLPIICDPWKNTRYRK